jgi:hypothetical protein
MSNYTSQIQGLYIAYFSRPADPAGLLYWEGVVAANGGNLQPISASFAASNEYKETFAGMNASETINTIYLNLFGRSAEPAGLLYWSTQLTRGVISIDNIVTAVFNAAQNQDKVVLDLKVAAALAFTPAVNTTSEILGYSGAESSAAAKDWLTGVHSVGDYSSTAVDTAVAKVVAAGNPPVTSYTLTPSSPSVNEGAHDLITLSTTNVAAGTVLGYTITGIDAARLVGGVSSGTVTVDASGKAVIDLGVVSNNHTDGATTATVALLNGQASAAVTVNDASLTPVPVTKVEVLTQGVDNLLGAGNANTTFNAYNVSPLNDTVYQTTLGRYDTVDGGTGSNNTFNLYSSVGFNDLLQGTVRNVQHINLYNGSDDAGLKAKLFTACVTNEITRDYLHELTHYQDHLGDDFEHHPYDFNLPIGDEDLADVYKEISHISREAVEQFVRDNSPHHDYKYTNDSAVDAIINSVSAALNRKVAQEIAARFNDEGHITWGDLYNAINAALALVGTDATNAALAVDTAQSALGSALSGISALQIAADIGKYGNVADHGIHYGVDAAFFAGSQDITLDNGWANVKNITVQPITLQNTGVREGTNGDGANVNFSFNAAAGAALNATVNLINDTFGTQKGDHSKHDKVTTLNILGADNNTPGDVFNLNVDGVTTSDTENEYRDAENRYHHSKADYNTINLLGFETINITSDNNPSSLGYIDASGRESKHDFDVISQQVVNIESNADLRIQVLDTNDTAGRLAGNASLVNITGAAATDIAAIDNSAGYDSYHRIFTSYQDGVIVNGAGATGDITLGDGSALENNVVSVTTGRGNDAVYLANGSVDKCSSTAVCGNPQATTTTVSLGGGDDILYLGGGMNHAGMFDLSYTGSPASTFTGDGGSGVNTLALDLGLAEFATYRDSNYTLAGQVSNFQHLELTGSIKCFGESEDLTWHISPEKLDAINYVVINTDTSCLGEVCNTNPELVSDYNWLTDGNNVEIFIHNLNGTANAAATLEYKSSQDDSLTVIGNGDTGHTLDVLNIIIDGAGHSCFNAANLIVKQTETLNIAANGDVSRADDAHITTDTIDIYDTYAKIVNVTGAGDLHLSLDSRVVTTLNASANNGGLDYTAAALTTALSITGSSADDTIDLTAVTKGATINASAGHDLYVVNSRGNTINFGTGVDDLHITATGSDEFTGMDVVNGFTHAGDAIKLDGGVGTLSKVASLGGLATFDDWVSAALVKAGSSHDAAWFQFGTDTFIVQDNNNDADFDGGTDIIVKLTGLVSLNTVTTVEAGHLVHV